MSWMSKKTGRRKEEGGHERINISVDKFTKEALQKIQKGDGNVSKFIEKQLKPVLENFDPGEASPVVWAIEAYVNKRILKALERDKPELVQALASLLTALKDFRELSGIPPKNFNLNEKAHSAEESRQVLGKREMIFTLISVLAISILFFPVLKDLSDAALPRIANQTGMTIEIMKYVMPVTPYLVLVPAVGMIIAYAYFLRKRQSASAFNS